MNEMEIKQLPPNDEFAQCMKKLRMVSLEFTRARQEEIRNCDHLFVKIRPGLEAVGFHSTDYYKDPDVVECVYCGLTNRFNRIEEILESEYIESSRNFVGMIPSSTKYMKKTIESKMFEEVFKNSYFRGGKSFNNLDINLISEECLSTYHPGLLYQLAIQIRPQGDNEELFEIMNQLNKLETSQEKLRLQSLEQATTLLDRYYASKPKSFILKK